MMQVRNCWEVGVDLMQGRHGVGMGRIRASIR